MNLKKKISIIIKLDGVLLLLMALMAVLSALQFGFPSNLSSMGHVQAEAVKIIWSTTLISVLILLALSFFCFKQKQVVLFFVVFYLILNLQKIIFNVHQMLTLGYVSSAYIFANLWGVLGLLALIFSLIGIVLFFMKKKH